MNSNFLFIKQINEDLYKLAKKAEERYLADDLDDYLIHSRRTVEKVINEIINREHLENETKQTDLRDRITFLYEKRADVSKSFHEKCHKIRRQGNDAVHLVNDYIPSVPIEYLYDIISEYTKKYHRDTIVPRFNDGIYKNGKTFSNIQENYDKKIELDKLKNKSDSDNKHNPLNVKITNDISSNKLDKKVDSKIISKLKKDGYEAIETLTSKQDSPFLIFNLKSTIKSEHKNAAVFATIFSMIHNSSILTGDNDIIFQELCWKEGESFNYKYVYIMINLLLLMIKHNEISDDNQINLKLIGWTGHKNDVKIAEEIINTMSQKICLLSNRIYSKINVKLDDVSGRKVKIFDLLEDDLLDDTIGITSISEVRFISYGIKQSTWRENDIIYSINPRIHEHTDIMKFFLKQFLGFAEFRDGQIEAISAILNDNTHKLCIMPTGSGKSLVFYFVALMRSGTVLVISPTELLVTDQIRNLKERHEWESIEVINSRAIINEFNPKTKLVYLTSEVFLNRQLILDLIEFNHSNLISHIVLDEVHCISNWSHDFRPEYLMLSFLLREFLDKTTYIGFTATANYSVVKDIMLQLGIKNSQILIPVELRNNNLKYHFIDCDNTIVIDKAVNTIESLVSENSKVICFTKDPDISYKLKHSMSEELRHKTDMFEGEIETYFEFAKGETKCLISDSSMGIGINLPDITDVVHVGSPLSKNNFVQEIGRASRTQYKTAECYVYYTSIKNTSNEDVKLFLEASTDISNILKAVKSGGLNSDIYFTYKNIFGHLDTKEELKKAVLELYKDIKNFTRPKLLIKTYDDQSNKLLLMRGLYILYRIGAIFAWYIVSDTKNTFENTIEFHITPKIFKLGNIKERTISYLRKLGRYDEYVSKIKESSSTEDLLANFVGWYYSEFYYQQRENALQMLEFFDHYKNRDANEINDHLKNYYSLNLIGINDIAVEIEKMTIKEIFSLANDDLEEHFVENIRKSMESEYSAKGDLFLFIYNLINKKSSDATRLRRVVTYFGYSDQLDLLTIIVEFYNQMDYKQKLQIVNLLSVNLGYERVIDSIYSKNIQDDAFSIIKAVAFNKYWEV